MNNGLGQSVVENQVPGTHPIFPGTAPLGFEPAYPRIKVVRSAEGIETWVRRGIQECMNQYN